MIGSACRGPSPVQTSNQTMLRWLFKRNRTHIFPDHYATNQQMLDQSICTAAEIQAGKGDFVLLVAHFSSTFSKTQELLDERELDYGIVTQPIDWSQDVGLIRSGLNKINLILAETFNQGFWNSETSPNAAMKVSVIVLERHPLFSVDARLLKSIRELPHSTQAGYYLSFDQPVITFSVDRGLQVVMKQFGMNNHSLVTSELITRRIAGKLKHFEREGSDWKQANSPEDWYAVNEPHKDH